jgi:hypothetical protein
MFNGIVRGMLEQGPEPGAPADKPPQWLEVPNEDGMRLEISNIQHLDKFLV